MNVGIERAMERKEYYRPCGDGNIDYIAAVDVDFTDYQLRDIWNIVKKTR